MFAFIIITSNNFSGTVDFNLLQGNRCSLPWASSLFYVVHSMLSNFRKSVFFGGQISRFPLSVVGNGQKVGDMDGVRSVLPTWYIWLVATVLNSEDTEHFHHHRKLYWAALG